jgi:hypothetical protein
MVTCHDLTDGLRAAKDAGLPLDHGLLDTGLKLGEEPKNLKPLN